MSTTLPSAAALLDAWEACQALGPLRRALALLVLARPELTDRALAELPIGRRDAELLRLRERLFGPRIVALARCPACGDAAEVTFATADIHVTPPDEAVADVAHDGYAVRVRAATTADLLDTESVDGHDACERAVLARCTIDARRDGVAVRAEELPDSVADAVAQALSAADPQADVGVAVACPACGERWPACFDAPAFLWREIDAWAKRALEEVHVLASAYGWSQADILSLSASRRRRYVAMVAGV